MPEPDGMAAAAICTDPVTAAELAAAGIDVVLILPEGAPFAAGRDGPGRIALLVGEAGDETVRAAAAAMGAELFGA